MGIKQGNRKQYSTRGGRKGKVEAGRDATTGLLAQQQGQHKPSLSPSLSSPPPASPASLPPASPAGDGDATATM